MYVPQRYTLSLPFIAGCKAWCIPSKKTWKVKCKFQGICDGCSKCLGEWLAVVHCWHPRGKKHSLYNVHRRYCWAMETSFVAVTDLHFSYRIARVGSKATTVKSASPGTTLKADGECQVSDSVLPRSNRDSTSPLRLLQHASHGVPAIKNHGRQNAHGRGPVTAVSSALVRAYAATSTSFCAPNC